jgi:hypothetical protein
MVNFGAYITAVILFVALGARSPLVALGQTKDDPESVIRGYINAANTGDVEAALSFWADDATYTVLPAAFTGQSTFVGKTQIRPLIEAFAAQHSRSEIQEPLLVDGERVSGRFRSAVDSFRQLGIEALESTAGAVVRDGKIQTATYRFTPESVARLEAARSAAAQSAPTQGAGAVAVPGDTNNTYLPAILAIGATLLGGVLAFRRWWQSQLGRVR